MKTLVLGLGNLLLADEGVGVHAAHVLAELLQDENVCIVDAGTAVLDVLPQIEEADQMIVIDACKGGAKPGTIYSFSLDECAEKEFMGSLHGFNLQHVLALTGRTTELPVTVIGIEPYRIEWSLDLTPEVAVMVPKVVEIVIELITASAA
ncbi:MAG: hydrogenase maturation protease [Candidatus Omnitrophica bacterium]|nr:hydrogenase maturation protease [Candidatus Omnitrophota bacterium]